MNKDKETLHTPPEVAACANWLARVKEEARALIRDLLTRIDILIAAGSPNMADPDANELMYQPVRQVSLEIGLAVIEVLCEHPNMTANEHEVIGTSEYWTVYSDKYTVQLHASEIGTWLAIMPQYERIACE